ncbi:MAG: type II toxin-antitoxin system RelE/ParE family toxin [Algicola sp.]|nr:type II toxin-antitoxin system RelE/ParE family toxin [Algicola sp.]
MPSKVQLDYASEFRKNIRHLSKKYRTIKSDLSTLFQELESGQTPGDQIQGTGATLYKVRVKNSDINKGKSGGYRVIYYIKQADKTVLLAIYSKNEHSDISSSFLHSLVNKYKM